MVATVIAGQFDADASAVARFIALALTGLSITVTQLGGPSRRPCSHLDR